MTITAAQKSQLLTAVDNAIEMKGCKYVFHRDPTGGLYGLPRPDTGMVPGCIIGQLAFLRGVPLDVLVDWDSGVHSPCAIDDILDYSAPGSERLRDIPVDILHYLQVMWDGRGDSLPADLRGDYQKAYGGGPEGVKAFIRDFINSLPVTE